MEMGIILKTKDKDGKISAFKSESGHVLLETGWCTTGAFVEAAQWSECPKEALPDPDHHAMLVIYPDGHGAMLSGREWNRAVERHNERKAAKLKRLKEALLDKSLREFAERMADMASKPDDDAKTGAKSVLDEGERRYLGAVLAPMRGQVSFIAKRYVGGLEVEGRWHQIVVAFKDGHLLEMPRFPLGSMYKGMRIFVNYTPEELGI